LAAGGGQRDTEKARQGGNAAFYNTYQQAVMEKALMDEFHLRIVRYKLWIKKVLVFL